MAATYTAVATGVTFSTTGKVLLQIFNASGSGVILKVYRIWLLNTQTAAVTGVLPPIELRRITAISTTGSPTTVTPSKHDTNSATLPAQVTVNYGNTSVTSTDVFRALIRSSDEPAVGTFSIDELSAIVPFNAIWDSGYGSTNIEPLVCREGQGIIVYNVGIASAAGFYDIIAEFTT